MNNKTKGIVVVIVAALVLSVWILKNQSEKALLSTNQIESSIPDSEVTEELDTSEFELNVTTELDMEQLKSYGLPIVIDFGADTCIPCKEMAPVLSELNESLKGKAIIKFVDVRKYREIGKDFPMKTIPTQFFFDKDGNPYSPSDSIDIKFTNYNINDKHVYTVHQGGLTKDQMLTILEELGME